MKKANINIHDATLLEEERRIIEFSKVDPEHFKVLYEKYYRVIFRYVFNKTNDKETTADIVSQVFVKALSGLSGYKDMGFPFSSWLYKIATNEVQQHFRKSNKHQWVSMDDQMLEQLCEDAKGPDLEELKVNLEKMIHELDEKEVQILELRYFENKTYKEVAFILDCTETSIKTRTFRIIEKIRKKILLHHEL